MKKFLKSYCVGFIISVLLCGSVYAATYFASSDVTYDNGVSGLKSENVQDAIDELYTECTKEPTAGETIIENAGLEKDPYECRYFFTGKSVNNYISFNNEKSWRIMSVECDGRIKIMRFSTLGDSYAWDEDGGNDWSAPSSLNTFLNNTFFNKLNLTAQQQVETSDFSIGAVTYKNYDLKGQITDENSKTWHGNIALPTISEYIRTNSDTTKCGTFLSHVGTYHAECNDTNWMYIDSQWWSLTISKNYGPYIIGWEGNIDDGSNVTSNGNYVRPTMYLKSSIKITGGTGTSSNPYQISL